MPAMPTRNASEKSFIQPVNESRMAIGWLPGYLNHPEHSITLIAKGTFDLHPDGRATLVDSDEPPPLTGDIHYDDDPTASLYYESDFVHYKPSTDLLLVGNCWVPGSKPVTSCPVTFQVGNWQRTLRVIGQRFWIEHGKDLLMSDPIPFRHGPLRYEYAFGGPEYPDNPIGKGLEKMMDTSNVERVALPNIEEPEHPLSHADQRPQPAGFGPLHRQWRQRHSKVGTYDEHWQETRWPWYAEDLDWSFFNAAPPQQQWPGYLTGNELISFENLHRDHQRFSSQLPGLRVRGFVHRRPLRGAEHGVFEEVQMHLDTLWIDSDQKRLVLVWRGSTNCVSESCDDIARVYFIKESLDADPISVSQAYERMNSTIAGDTKSYEFSSEDDAEIQAVKAEIEQDRQEMAQLEEHYLGKHGSDPNESARNLYRAQLVRMGRDPSSADEWQPHNEDSTLARQREIEAEYEFDKMPGPHRTEAVDRESCLKAIARGDSLSERDLTGIDLSGADIRGADLSEAILEGANLQEAQLNGARLVATNLRGAILNGAELVEADLSLAELTGAQITRANLRRATLDGASLREANLQNSRMDRIRAFRTEFEQADLSRASLAEAFCDEADFSGCRLDGSIWEGASLKGSHLEGVTGSSVDLTNANLHAANLAEGSQFVSSRFIGIQADESIWDSASLQGCDFSGASLRMADLSYATLDAANMYHVDLAQARLTSASLVEVNLERSNLFQASLEKSNLTKAILDHSNLYEAETRDAKFEDSRLDGAILHMTKLA